MKPDREATCSWDCGLPEDHAGACQREPDTPSAPSGSALSATREEPPSDNECSGRARDRERQDHAAVVRWLDERIAAIQKQNAEFARNMGLVPVEPAALSVLKAERDTLLRAERASVLDQPGETRGATP